MVCTIWRLASFTQHMPFRFIHVVPHINSLFLLLLDSIPLYGCNSLSFTTFVNFSGTIASIFFFPVLYSFCPSWCHTCYTFWYCPQVVEALTFWEHCYSSFSVIHSGNYFWTLVIYSPIASHAAVSNFFSTIIIMLLCEHSPWVHVPGFLHGICLWMGLLGCRTCIFFSFTYTVQSGHTNLPVYKSLPASYSFQHLVLSGFLFFIHTMGMKWNHVF